MTEILKNIGSEALNLLVYFVTVALLQNIVLTTGFGTTVMLHIVRSPKNIWLFGGILTVFSTLTALITFPLDGLLGTAVTNLFRPLMVIAITAVLYCLITALLRWKFKTFYARVQRMLPIAAFNNLVIGVVLIAGAQSDAGLGGMLGLTIGSSLGFTLLTWLTAEGIERLDNPDMPESFRGMPATLIYISLLALALMDFTSTSFLTNFLASFSLT